MDRLISYKRGGAKPSYQQLNNFYGHRDIQTVYVLFSVKVNSSNEGYLSLTMEDEYNSMTVPNSFATRDKHFGVGIGYINHISHPVLAF